MTITTSVRLARFPLVPRPRPRALSLEERVRELMSMVSSPGPKDNQRRATQAAEVFNKAALIASDADMPDVARTLCWRQHAVYEKHGPLPDWAAPLALQPLLNLVRQVIRDGDGPAAHALLETLLSAAGTGRDVTFLDQTINLRHLIQTPEGHAQARSLVWTALLADGVRALALAGRWKDAADYAAKHRGVGQRLLDGRQVAILALLDDDEVERAIDLIDNSDIREPWELCIQALLYLICMSAANLEATERTSAAVEHAAELFRTADPSLALFRTRVGLTALELAQNIGAPQVEHLRDLLFATAVTDAYAARDVLDHCTRNNLLSPDKQLELAGVTLVSGFGVGELPRSVHHDFFSTVEHAEAMLTEALRA